VTPWKTHFGSEEYEPDARVLADNLKANASGTEWMDLDDVPDYVTLYMGMAEDSTNEEVAAKFFPYKFGYPWEACFSPLHLSNSSNFFHILQGFASELGCE
jgi:uncharacterized protein